MRISDWSSDVCSSDLRGLHVILTAFHETSRIDRQLEGRAGRQGDPGSSQAITAIDDELYTLFAPRAAKLVKSTAKAWQVGGRAADIPRRLAQEAAERRHAAHRQTGSATGRERVCTYGYI